MLPLIVLAPGLFIRENIVLYNMTFCSSEDLWSEYSFHIHVYKQCKITVWDSINALRLVTMCRWNGSTLVQVMAWCLISHQAITWTNAVSISQLDPQEQKIWIKKNQTLPTKWWPYCPDLNVLITPLMMKNEHLKTLSSLHDKWMECILTLVWSNCKPWFLGHDYKVSEQHTRERLKTTGPRHHSKLKMPFYQYKNRYWSDMMILRPSYLHNGPRRTD